MQHQPDLPDFIPFTHASWQAQPNLRSRAASSAVSMLVHMAAIGALIWLSTTSVVQNTVTQVAKVIYLPNTPAPKLSKPKAGGGGGGDRSPLPASAGRLPKPAKIFIPPQAVPRLEQPKLELDASILREVEAPKVAMDIFGDPLSAARAPSNGQGLGIGIGNKDGSGVGNAGKDGVGNGDKGGFGDVLVGGRGGVTMPVALYKPEPEYSEEARKSKFQGSVRLTIVIDARGNPRDIRVKRPLGLGLDEKAIEAVMKWRFRAATKDGKPVPVMADVEVNFRLL